jgi:uncharacterized membrane protein
MHSHLALLIIFSFFVSLVFALLSKDTVAEQIRFGATLFFGFIGSAIILGWLMYPFPF